MPLGSTGVVVVHRRLPLSVGFDYPVESEGLVDAENLFDAEGVHASVILESVVVEYIDASVLAAVVASVLTPFVAFVVAPVVAPVVASVVVASVVVAVAVEFEGLVHAQNPVDLADAKEAVESQHCQWPSVQKGQMLAAESGYTKDQRRCCSLPRVLPSGGRSPP